MYHIPMLSAEHSQILLSVGQAVVTAAKTEGKKSIERVLASELRRRADSMIEQFNAVQPVAAYVYPDHFRFRQGSDSVAYSLNAGFTAMLLFRVRMYYPDVKSVKALAEAGERGLELLYRYIHARVSRPTDGLKNLILKEVAAYTESKVRCTYQRETQILNQMLAQGRQLDAFEYALIRVMYRKNCVPAVRHSIHNLLDSELLFRSGAVSVELGTDNVYYFCENGERTGRFFERIQHVLPFVL